MGFNESFEAAKSFAVNAAQTAAQKADTSWMEAEALSFIMVLQSRQPQKTGELTMLVCGMVDIDH